PAQQALARFNQYARTKFDVKLASLDAIDALKTKPARICPLICEHGFRADGETCVKITCKAGYEVGSDNSCERVEPKKPKDKPAVAAKPATSAPGTGPAPMNCRNVNAAAAAGGASLEPRPRCADLAPPK